MDPLFAAVEVLVQGLDVLGGLDSLGDGALVGGMEMAHGALGSHLLLDGLQEALGIGALRAVW